MIYERTSQQDRDQPVRVASAPIDSPPPQVREVARRSETQRSFIFWAIGFAVVAVAAGTLLAIDILLFAFAGTLLAIFFRGMGDAIAKVTPLNQTWSVALAVLLIAGLLVGAGFFVAPRIAAQVDEMRETLPQAVESLKQSIERYRLGNWIMEQTPNFDQLRSGRINWVGGVTGVISGTMWVIGMLVVMCFIGIYLAFSPQQYRRGVIQLMPPQSRQRGAEIIDKVGSTLRWWLLGKMASMLIVGVLTWLGLWLLGIELAFTLALIAAVLTFIPNFGPIIAAIPAVLLGLLESPTMALWVVLLYVGIQAVESYLITPLIQKRTVSLPPALTITAQLVLGVLLGGVGLALATPLTAVGLVLVRELYVKRVEAR